MNKEEMPPAGADNPEFLQQTAAGPTLEELREAIKAELPHLQARLSLALGGLRDGAPDGKKDARMALGELSDMLDRWPG